MLQIITDYPITTSKVIIGGGGANVFFDMIKDKFISHSEMAPNPQYANVEGFNKVGVAKWGKQY